MEPHIFFSFYSVFVNEEPNAELSETDLDEAMSAIELLISTVQDSVKENQSKQFAEQLIHLTMLYLGKVSLLHTLYTVL